MRGDLVFTAPARTLEPIIFSLPNEMPTLATLSWSDPASDKDLIVLEEQTSACTIQTDLETTDEPKEGESLDKDTESVSKDEGSKKAESVAKEAESVDKEAESVEIEDVFVAMDTPTKDVVPEHASSEDGDFVMCPCAGKFHFNLPNLYLFKFMDNRGKGHCYLVFIKY